MSATVVEPASEPVKQDQAVSNLEQQGRRLGGWMTLPAQLLLLFIVAFPLCMQIYISMTDWGPTDGVDWIYAYQSRNWFDNYATFFSDRELWASILRTLLIMVVAVSPQRES